VAEVRETRRALAQRKLEGGNGRERRPDAQNLEQLTGCAVDRDNPFAEAIAKHRRFGPLR
jgi:hypothetical protein